MTFRLLQVCNVGQIVGGTAACAWTVTRSLPDAEHVVAFLGGISDETVRVFAPCRVVGWRDVSAANLEAVRPDVVLLHNTPRDRCRVRPMTATVQYLHSRVTAAPADVTVCCSSWLARQTGRDDAGVLLQGVPRAGRETRAESGRRLRDEVVIGRICTPQRKKWPAGLVRFYSALAGRFPEVRWEFVGCPAELQGALLTACGGRAEFLPAGWGARRRLWDWDAMLYHHPELTESFGRTAAEAMRCGCVPIVDGRGGFVEQVAAGCGYLCASTEEFSAAVGELLDAARRLRMSRAARAHADEQFSLERFGRDLVGRLEEAVRRRARRC